ncbi:MAG: PEP-CTERM sorting domain-containing protein [Opitutaceae bacterium]|nr:PEP-CTERM sorting domain-containing protein [Opitutaceae bacterium]
MDSQFTQFGAAAIGDGGYNVAGYFVAPTTASAPTATKMYIWSFNSVAAASATQWGIFSNSGPTWTTASSAPDVLAMDISQANVADFGTLNAGFAMTSAVPEPATYAAILGLVTLGLVGYRRFRRS